MKCWVRVPRAPPVFLCMPNLLLGNECLVIHTPMHLTPPPPAEVVALKPARPHLVLALLACQAPMPRTWRRSTNNTSGTGGMAVGLGVWVHSFRVGLHPWVRVWVR